MQKFLLLNTILFLSLFSTAQIDNALEYKLDSISITTKKVDLIIDWNSLGLNPENIELFAPEIEAFQPRKVWEPNESIVVPKGKGYLIIIRYKK